MSEKKKGMRTLRGKEKAGTETDRARGNKDNNFIYLIGTLNIMLPPRWYEKHNSYHSNNDPTYTSK